MYLKNDVNKWEFIYTNMLAGIGLGIGFTLIAMIFRVVGLKVAAG